MNSTSTFITELFLEVRRPNKDFFEEWRLWTDALKCSRFGGRGIDVNGFHLEADGNGIRASQRQNGTSIYLYDRNDVTSGDSPEKGISVYLDLLFLVGYKDNVHEAVGRLLDHIGIDGDCQIDI